MDEREMKRNSAAEPETDGRTERERERLKTSLMWVFKWALIGPTMSP